MSKKQSIIIYRDHLLPASETFVRAQAEALQHFTPYYVGSRLVQGLPVPKERTLVINRGHRLLGKANEYSFKLWGFAPTFFQQVRNLNPEIIHAHFGSDGALALPLARNLRVPLLITFHGFDAAGKDEYARRSFYSHQLYLRRRELLKHETQMFIAVSEFIKKKLLEQDFPPEKIVVHYIGIDTELFRPNPVVVREPIVLFVGRLTEKKGCEYLIRAMKGVQAAMPEVELVVIGEGLLRPSLERLAGEMLRRYRFLGVQPPESVRAWMNRAKVFCVPSVTAESGDSEGFGMVFAEAQAIGLPVVSFASGGILEAVKHGETGFLVTERKWEELTMHILLLLEEEILWHCFSENGQHRVHTLFNLHKQTSVLENLYQQILNPKGEFSLL
ncbi:glycosyltransferase [Chroococcidiopsis sp. CCMEE 29]|uniref:glycosyltransferase n=1 Tax=Chroococcidiopsis sp. CCMEE 29 TaxID=155894 RepID=UPI00202201DE|nr:glycosyltransferase [Chroococcidiopsis sp. CCMEE 29]